AAFWSTGRRWSGLSAGRSVTGFPASAGTLTDLAQSNKNAPCLARVRKLKWWGALAVPWHRTPDRRSKGGVRSFFPFQPRRQAVEPDEHLDVEPRPHHRPRLLAHQHLGDERAGVVGASLHRTIGACRHEREKIAGLDVREFPVLGE